jgi:hypothetical protein
MDWTTRRKSVVAAVVVIILCLSLGVGRFVFFYVDGAYQGRVLDMESNQPIEGAVIMGVWTRVSIGAHPVETYHDVQETLSDREGNFIIPGTWGASIPLISGVREPEFVIFKPNYAAFRGSWNAKFSPGGPVQLSQQDGRSVFQLRRLTVREERVANMGKLSLHLCVPGRSFPRCIPRESVPHLIRLEDLEYNELWAQ